MPIRNNDALKTTGFFDTFRTKYQMLESRKVSKKYVPPSVKSDGRAKNNIEGTYFYSVVYGRLDLTVIFYFSITTLTISFKIDLIITAPIVRVTFML